MAFVRNPVVYVPDLTNGRPIVDGKVYILTAGTVPPMHDSAIDPLDLVTVSYYNEANNLVAQPQPLYTSKGGCLYGNYPDAARQFIISPQAYVFAVYNRIGQLEYSAETTASDYVETNSLAAANSTVLVGGVEAQAIAKLREFLTPDMFSGANDDAKFSAMKAAMLSTGIKVAHLVRQYSISTFNIDTDMTVLGVNPSAEILFSGSVGFNVTAAHTIKNIKFTTTRTSATGAPLGVYAFESGETSGCTFINCRLYYRNNTSTIKEKAITPDNVFVCNFTNFDPIATESDCLTVRGFKYVVQDRCDFTCTNVHRVVKNGIAVFAFPTDYADFSTSPKFISQKQIKVRGTSAAGNKQVFDNFTCQGGVYINDECDVEVTGFGVVYENKTNRANADNDTTEIISKPHFRNNGSCIKVEGNRGNTAAGGIYALGRKKLFIMDDDCENTGTGAITGSYGIIDVKYCDTFKYEGGVIKDKAGNNNQAMLIGGCRSVDLDLGNIIGCYVRFQDTTGSQQGDTHSAFFDIINVTGGSFADCSNPLQGFIVFRTVVNTSLAIAVTGVAAKNATATAASGGLVCLRDMTAYSVTVNGCSIKQVSSVDERVFTSNATVTKYLTSGNSWQGAALP